MSETTKPFANRRTLLLAGAGVAGAGAVLYGGAFGAGALRTCPTNGALSALDEPALARVGELYLASAGAEERARLSGLLRRAGADVGAFAATLAEHASADFAAGHVVSCDGWMLALSEARACALVALAGRSA